MDETRAAIESIGLIVDHLQVDGAFHRTPVVGKRNSNLAGAYCLRELVLRNGERAIVGIAKNWVSGEQVVFDLAERIKAMSDEERAAAKAALKAAQQAARQAQQQLQAETRERAALIWDSLPDSGVSEYLHAKGVKAWGLRFSRGSIVVPVRDAGGTLHGLQFIDGRGGKKFLTGTAKKGCFHLLGTPVDGLQIAVAEGYATAATLHEALQLPVATAFDAGNLQPVAQALAARYPDCKLVICADNDRATPGNPGVTKARAAARAVQGQVFVPEFEAV